MSESTDDERDRIRERKLAELQTRLENQGAIDGGSAGPASPSTPIAIEGIEHLQRVVDDHDVVLVDCYADWCGPCQMMEPTIQALARETDAAVAKVDVDANPDVAAQLGAQSIPTLVLYAGGEPVQRLIGAQDRGTLRSLIERHG